MRHRKKFAVTTFVAALATLLAACGSTDGSASAGDSESKSITFVMPTPAWDVSLSVLAVAQEEGYYEDEGLDVKYVLSEGSLNAATAVAQNPDSVGFVSPEPVVIAAQEGKGLGLEFFYNYVRRPIYNLAVAEDSDIQGVKDLRGKKIGVQSLTAVGVYYINAYLRAAGVDPDEVTLVPTGGAAQALTALDAGKSDAQLINDVWQAIWRDAGVETRVISKRSQLSTVQHGLLARTDSLSDNPETYAGIGRAMAKATVFTLENPEAAIRLMWKAHPETKPTGVDDDEAMQRSLEILNSQIPNLELDSGQKWGQYPESAFAESVDFAKESGMITKDVDPSTLYTDALVEKFNDFDEESVKSEADGG